jgi:hypothetical protein
MDEDPDPHAGDDDQSGQERGEERPLARQPSAEALARGVSDIEGTLPGWVHFWER